MILFQPNTRTFEEIKAAIEERDYEQAQLDGESIDEIFADVEDLKDEK